MPLKRKDLSAVKWHEHFAYDPVAGNLVWKERELETLPSRKAWMRWKTMYSGKVAGSIDRSGYRVVHVSGKNWLVHRVIFFMHHGFAPAEVDHMDRTKLNNRIENLRAADHGQNQVNAGVPRNSGTGLKGVTKNHDGWMARIAMNGKRICLGTYPTKGLAAVAHAKASIQHYGQFSPFVR